MRPRLILVLLLLVVLPTGVLSLMATRTLRNWEAILVRNMELAAQTSLDDVRRSVSQALDDDLHGARLIMTDCLVRGWEASRVEEAATRARDDLALVEEVYVFMNPWGLLYPEQTRPGAVTADSAPSMEREALVAELREKVASRELTETIFIEIGAKRYCFLPVQDRKSLYVGYEVSGPAFAKRLQAILAAQPPGVCRVIRTSAMPHSGADPIGVVITDPFGAATVVEAPGSPGSPKLALQTKFWPRGGCRLPSPLSGCWPSSMNPARYAGPAGTERGCTAGESSLLAFGIVAGTVAVLRDAATTIRRAQARSDFVIGVSHDLRTPIASMRMLAESLYLERIPDREKQKVFLGMILRESERLSQLVERVLFLVRFGEGRFVFRMESIDLGEVVRGAVETFQARYIGGADGSPKGPVVAVQCGEGTPRVPADANAIRRCCSTSSTTLRNTRVIRGTRTRTAPVSA